MKIQKTTAMRSAMLALLGGAIYQGLTFATGFEVSQQRNHLRQGTPTEQSVRVSHSVRANAASLYAAAAAQLPSESPVWIRNGVDLASFQENRQAAAQWVDGQPLALQLLAQAATMRQCHFEQDGLLGSDQIDYAGLRRLVQVGCLGMMARAESGEFESAVKLGQDVSAMIQNLETSPTALRHAISVVLADQLGKTVKELSLAYPSAEFQALRGSLHDLADRLDSGLAQAPMFERERAVASFQALREGRGKPAESTLDILSQNFNLLSYQQELDYLTTSEQIESALAAHDLVRLEKITSQLPESDCKAVPVIPNWSIMANRHQQIVKSLRI